MEARGAGPVTEWVVEEDARLTLLSPPPGEFGERSMSWHGSQGCKQETTSPKMTGRRHEAGRQARSFPSSRSQSGMRAGDDIRSDDGATARGRAPEFSRPLAPSQECEQETAMVVPRRFSRDKQTAGVL